MNEKRQVKLINKIKRLLKRLGMPRWLHHFGPKTYEFYQHLCALLVRFYCRLSYRRVVQFLDLLDIKCPSKSALNYTMIRINSLLWQRILKATAGTNHYIVAIDSTGFSRVNPSYHYLRRINGQIPKIPIKLSAAFDTRKKKFCAAKIRVLPAHDIRDAKFLLKQTKSKIIVADKGYNSEKLYEFAEGENILLMSPAKRNTKKGFWRKKMQKQFRIRTYHRRELIEAGNSNIKRKFGASVSSKMAKTIRGELYGRLTCHNLFLLFYLSLRTEPIVRKALKRTYNLKYHANQRVGR